MSEEKETLEGKVGYFSINDDVGETSRSSRERMPDLLPSSIGSRKAINARMEALKERKKRQRDQDMHHKLENYEYKLEVSFSTVKVTCECLEMCALLLIMIGGSLFIQYEEYESLFIFQLCSMGVEFITIVVTLISLGFNISLALVCLFITGCGVVGIGEERTNRFVHYTRLFLLGCFIFELVCGTLILLIIAFNFAYDIIVDLTVEELEGVEKKYTVMGTFVGIRLVRMLICALIFCIGVIYIATKSFFHKYTVFKHYRHEIRKREKISKKTENKFKRRTLPKFFSRRSWFDS